LFTSFFKRLLLNILFKGFKTFNVGEKKKDFENISLFSSQRAANIPPFIWPDLEKGGFMYPFVGRGAPRWPWNQRSRSENSIKSPECSMKAFSRWITG